MSLNSSKELFTLLRPTVRLSLTCGFSRARSLYSIDFCCVYMTVLCYISHTLQPLFAQLTFFYGRYGLERGRRSLRCYFLLDE